MLSKKKKRQEALNQRDSKKFFITVGIAVAVLMLLLFLIFRNM